MSFDYNYLSLQLKKKKYIITENFVYKVIFSFFWELFYTMLFIK